MNLQRVSKTTTISLPPSLYRQAMHVARSKGMTRSELFREAFRRLLMEEARWQELLDYGRRKAQEMGIKTEEDVDRVIHEIRTKKASRRR